MRYGLALLAVLAIGGCHRRSSEVMPGADAEARRAAAQQTSEDLAAAGDAAQQPIAASQPRAVGRARPARLMPDATAEAAGLPVAGNVSQEDAPIDRN